MRITIMALTAVLFAQSLRAEAPKPIEITIYPQAVETPVLKYRLFPTESERKPGNAAPILLRLPWEQQPWMTKVYPTLHEWNERPLTAPEWKSWDNAFPERFYGEMRRAAFRRQAGWEYPLEETQALYAILLPDVQGLRTFLAAGLSAKIRYHITRGELDQAREGILVGLANGQHLAQTPFLITQLVAAAIDQFMFKRLEELISQPNSPNLYWALSTLPHNMIELERAASFEASLFETMLPAVKDLDRPRDIKEWRKMAIQLIDLLEQSQEVPPVRRPKSDLPVLNQILEGLDAAGKTHFTTFIKQARTELPAMIKVPAEKVATMSDEEAGIRWYVQKRLARDQAMGAILTLPPPEAWQKLVTLQAEMKAMNAATGAKSAGALFPFPIYVSAWSLKRKVESLRVIEAIRHYTATHEGQLPATLDAITDLPIPLDPLTNLPFEWAVTGKTAVLKTPPLPAFVNVAELLGNHNPHLEYQLQVK
ncbi:MAG: hypothetical protein JWM11_5785 [Planctomycetaceae bacterium]|nr:hypothetical protein [Planctomycetaceae bacterium]